MLGGESISNFWLAEKLRDLLTEKNPLQTSTRRPSFDATEKHIPQLNGPCR